MKYAGMVGQLFVLLLLSAFLGQFLDDKFDTNIFTPILLIVGLGTYLYRLYIDLTRNT